MTSVSPSAVELCKTNGIEVIPGSCPNQFLNPDGAHKFMRGLWKMLGFFEGLETPEFRFHKKFKTLLGELS